MKASDNPPICYPPEQTLQQFEGNWWVAHTRSRNEKALAHDLMSHEISYFLPMTWTVSKKSRRATKSLLPLFTGYLFFCGNEEQRVNVLKTNRVANLIAVPEPDIFVGELAQIEQALQSGVPLVPHQSIQKGQWCRVIAGPLMGLEGMVVEVKNITRLLLQIDMLGQAASVEIDLDMVEPIDQPQYPPSTEQNNPVARHIL